VFTQLLSGNIDIYMTQYKCNLPRPVRVHVHWLQTVVVFDWPGDTVRHRHSAPPIGYLVMYALTL